MELARAGVLADGLHPSSGAIRISYPEPGQAENYRWPLYGSEGTDRGYTLIEVKTREEAIEWAKRMPDPHGFGGADRAPPGL